MGTEEVRGPKAPKDPIKKKPFFFIMQGKDIYGAPQPDGRGIQFIYESDGRLINAARLSGNITDDYMLELLKTTEGFRKMVHSIGVSVSSRVPDEKVRFVFQMYGETQTDPTSTQITLDFETDGMERIIKMSDVDWKASDKEPGQIRFEFPEPGIQASVDVRFYLNNGFVAPIQPIDTMVDFASKGYKEMIGRSLMQTGNTARLEKVLQKAGKGEDVCLAFIGGSITQGAGAIPIHEKCYPRLFAETFEKKYTNGGKVDFIKAGVGGTPSELGMCRFERDILRQGAKQPDLIVIEFAVNDEGDETKGVCYESLVRKALALPWKPAVVLLFAVFSFDWNLQDRLGPVGVRYDLPMVSIMDAVTPQFTLLPNDGRIISKNQFFYDQFHPSNLGHQVMSDCLINLVDEVNGKAVSESFSLDEKELDKITPVIGADFEKVELVDKHELKRLSKKYHITLMSEGSFNSEDKELQMVEMDKKIEPVAELPYNWAHASTENDPFRLKLTCSKLLLLFKDSGSTAYGTAEVYVDGKKVMDADPLKVGWTHCNAVILFNEKESASHIVEICMAKGHEDKKFTILGFGVVE
ncbi:SGNH/GDSL hydrolase family protein [Butyrivibrio sp. INlla14]|uniref:SGNH/GDSL hydrolase family protein n=1 Tax=Butyrivibrio sp. INlla14 TaxID=1520808 RepID=UPI00087747A4|nr:SGNH/GDSL hydrolase family protein [Butyrivibrio sp. INlla14]SCY39181.1 Lysophospholipase L1 [Butyrivibrio sp. INlla14]